jgi:2-polyprenyl-3-methyl-5-hydroxy-6-metoxy-1,4-benzoquinol methylase
MSDLENYLKSFEYGESISNPELWKEMDRIWNHLNLDNKRKFSSQNIGQFYAHPVWTLNGLFSEKDQISYSHREKIVDFAKMHFKTNPFINVADFGGGSGVLAKIFEMKMPQLKQIDIVEPWPSDFFLNKLREFRKINFVDDFENNNFYELIISQDVLEHVENPIEVAFECFDATKIEGIVLFANCFYPVIECHLPKNFYLRHLFKYVVTSKNLKYLGKLPGVNHVEIYQKIGPVKFDFFIKFKMALAKLCGPMLNYIVAKFYNNLLK